MRTMMYKNDNAIFDFVLPDVIDRLKYHSDQKVKQATEILDAICSCPSKVIKIESNYFGHIVLDLIKAGKGHAYCNFCRKMYDSNQLTSRPLGFEKSHFQRI
jgi:redox-regulated HSP33 family molecular chaperone